MARRLNSICGGRARYTISECNWRFTMGIHAQDQHEHWRNNDPGDIESCTWAALQSIHGLSPVWHSGSEARGRGFFSIVVCSDRRTPQSTSNVNLIPHRTSPANPLAATECVARGITGGLTFLHRACRFSKVCDVLPQAWVHACSLP